MRILGTILCCVVLFSACNQPPPVEMASNPDWSPDTTKDWSERLHCPNGDGYVVLQSQQDLGLYERYDSVVYVLERRGRYWIGQQGSNTPADPKISSWSIRSAHCGGIKGE